MYYFYYSVTTMVLTIVNKELNEVSNSMLGGGFASVKKDSIYSLPLSIIYIYDLKDHSSEDLVNIKAEILSNISTRIDVVKVTITDRKGRIRGEVPFMLKHSSSYSLPPATVDYKEILINKFTFLKSRYDEKVLWEFVYSQLKKESFGDAEKEIMKLFLEYHMPYKNYNISIYLSVTLITLLIALFSYKCYPK